MELLSEEWRHVTELLIHNSAHIKNKVGIQAIKSTETKINFNILVCLVMKVNWRKAV